MEARSGTRTGAIPRPSGLAGNRVSEETSFRKGDDGFSLTIRRGERWAVMGRNGAGKTTLLKMIVGAEVPDPLGKR